MIELIAILLCLVFSFFFSGTESAFTSLSASQIEGLQSSPDKNKLLVYLTNRIKAILITALIGNNLMNVTISVLASTLTIRYIGNSFLGITTGIVTYVILITGEVIPKYIAVTYNEQWAAKSAKIVYITSLILRPALWVVQGTLSIVKIDILSKNQENHQERDINLLNAINVAKKRGVVGRRKFRLLRNLLYFDSESIESILIHRTQVFSVPHDMSIATAMQKMITKGFSRVPVYQHDPENIVGVALMKEVMASYLRDNVHSQKLHNIMHQPIFISMNWSLENLFIRLSNEHQGMAVVLDEFGGMAGIVTLKNLFERIFGKLYDENESTTEYIKPDSPHSFKIQTSIPIALLNEHLSLRMPEKKGMKTLGGYIVQNYSGVPQEGTTIETPFGTLVVLSASKDQVHEVLFRKYRPAAKATAKST